MRRYQSVRRIEAGSVALPEEALEALGVTDGGEVTVVVEDGEVRLCHASPGTYTDPEDGFVFGPGHEERLRQALADYESGRVVTLTSDRLRQLLGVADDSEDA
ncbi:MAG: hypothetical protein IT303_15210 [Dehalococcoidia bacterium]|nr:hypothetical protein [Dehalococcoidia bacterium]